MLIYTQHQIQHQRSTSISSNTGTGISSTSSPSYTPSMDVTMQYKQPVLVLNLISIQHLHHIEYRMTLLYLHLVIQHWSNI